MAGPHGTKATGAGLKDLNSLQGLHLSFNQNLTDTGLEHLKDLTNLKYLHLRNTQITDAGLKHLEGLTNLKVLGLKTTKVTDGGVDTLKQALPMCRIEYP